MNTVFHYDQVQNIPDFIIEKKLLQRTNYAGVFYKFFNYS